MGLGLRLKGLGLGLPNVGELPPDSGLHSMCIPIYPKEQGHLQVGSLQLGTHAVNKKPLNAEPLDPTT